ncbi:hypothetical protein PSTG_01402 [Puccinia striiformis f. sp. tritici PST-78]|uniref:Uncharacterized protein n=1 Tax=Puccinia striiformis f. sp. tritici PST-78 TaxID=1165861 RepID=A0A0L0W294_9BASI|nr:hypothetical protein PSTG_01402 [Puccinia striiformis f. sp. tritici PST-78]
MDLIPRGYLLANNACTPLGVHFLELVAASGGLPLRLIAHRQAETVHMISYQIQLSQRYSLITLKDALTRMQTNPPSTNQKIELMWQAMRRELTLPAKELISKRIEDGKYMPDHKIQRQVDTSNQHQRFDPLPWSSELAYSFPQSFGCTDQKINVPNVDIERMLESGK